MTRRSIALALCCSLACSPAYATTFIGVLWPLFGAPAAPGLVEFVTELQSMPDVEVKTYQHPEWPSVVDDINRQPAGTHIIVIGYSLGANNAVLIANNTNYIDSIIALQPSIFTPNVALTGKVGRIVEIYNPNPWMTFGGMGSQKLIGPNIEYIANNDSHPGAPYNSEFRDLVRSEIARLSAEQTPNSAQSTIAQPSQPAKPARTARLPKVQVVKKERPQGQSVAPISYVDAIPSSVNSDSAAQRTLTTADMMKYIKRTYEHRYTADLTTGASR
jgi:hypothetical protein